jgi:anti-anti-sigma factor
MNYEKVINHTSVVIRMRGTFTHEDTQSFQHIIEHIKLNDVSDITLDLNDVEFIDSSAMGMLLLMKNESSKLGIATKLDNVTGQVWKIINLTHFDKIFDVNSQTA